MVRAAEPNVATTSFGISTIHLAAAVRDNGAGQVISTELNAAKVAQARAAWERIAGRSWPPLAKVRTICRTVTLEGW
jgi:hypothetical protein